MQIRFARHTDRLDDVVGFYRDGLGLPELGRFDDHAGYHGVLLDLPGSGTHLEFTTGGDHAAPAAHPETLLVLYLGTLEAVERTRAALGAEPVEPANPYWRTNGITVADPDGSHVVLAGRPWPPPAS